MESVKGQAIRLWSIEQGARANIYSTISLKILPWTSRKARKSSNLDQGYHSKGEVKRKFWTRAGSEHLTGILQTSSLCQYCDKSTDFNVFLTCISVYLQCQCFTNKRNPWLWLVKIHGNGPQQVNSNVAINHNIFCTNLNIFQNNYLCFTSTEVLQVDKLDILRSHVLCIYLETTAALTGMNDSNKKEKKVVATSSILLSFA